MKDSEFLEWLSDRLTYHYGEDSNIDFVMRLNDITKRLKGEGK